jgi:hypothetical protein
MNKNDLLIHSGYQKTGTTWLQKHLFNNPTIGFAKPFGPREISEALVFPFPLTFDAEQCDSYLAPPFQQARDDGLFPVLSRERLSGSLCGGGYDSKEIADRLVRVFPAAKILIVIREQRAMLLSSYQQTVKGSSCLSLKQFLNQSQREKQRVHLFNLERFNTIT